jgi:hypothetical protein
MAGPRRLIGIWAAVVRSTAIVATATALVPARGLPCARARELLAVPSSVASAVPCAQWSAAVSCPAQQMQARGSERRGRETLSFSTKADGRELAPCARSRHPAHALQAAERDDAVLRSDGLAVSMSALRTRFCEGDYYVWLYRDEAGVPTSWERYSVTRAAAGDGTITIEMATKFARDHDFFTHHRMIVDLRQHVLAEESRDGWKIGFEYLDEDGRWTANGAGDNVQAFEEKFDVFEMLAGARARETREAKVRARLREPACARESARARTAPNEGRGAADQR